MGRRLIAVLLLTTLTGVVHAQETRETVRMTLQQCMDRMVMVSPEIEQAELAVRQLEARLSEAKFAAILPQFQLTNTFGPSPGVSGNPDSLETIRNDLGDLSVFSRMDIQLVQPIYTFGKLGGAREAARHGVAAGQAGVVRKKGDILLQTQKLFHGLALAKALRDVVMEARENVQKARDKIDQLIEEESDNVSSTDILKINVFEYDVLKNLARADKSIALGKAALMTLMKIDRRADFDIVTPQEEPEPVELEPLDTYVAKARASRPDVKQLQSGLQVRRSLMKVTRSDFFPQIAFVGSFQWGYAPNRPHFSNPFLRDDFNFLRMGGLIVLRQQFSFGLTSAKYRAQKAELADLMSKENQAINAIGLEVEQAYREVLEANGNVSASDTALRSAKSWMTSAAMGFDITGDSSELLTAFTAYSRMRQENLQAIFNLSVAGAVLDQVTGAYTQQDRP